MISQSHRRICWVAPAEMVTIHIPVTRDDPEREIIDVDFEDISDQSPDEFSSSSTTLQLPQSKP